MKDSHVDQKKLRQSDYNNAFKIDLRNEIQDSFGTNPTPWFQCVFNHIGMDKHAAVLDLGCGSGQFWQQNKERISPYLQLTMADLSHGMVQDARQRLERTYAGPEFAVSDGQALTFLNDSFEIVLAIGVLDHVPNVNQTLGEIWRVLRPSGLLVASAGGHNHLAELRALLRPFLPRETADLLGGAEERFGLENGERLLSAQFEEVTRLNYSDRLVFDQPQPILDYIFSETEILQSMRIDQLGELIHQLRHILNKQGVLKMTVRKGLFLARKKVVL
jgi:ubiquinone/menaquinone biosynthesis C-methylase UbiE